MKDKYNFTKSFLDSVKKSEKGKRDFYRDSKVNALEVMVTD